MSIFNNSHISSQGSRDGNDMHAVTWLDVVLSALLLWKREFFLSETSFDMNGNIFEFKIILQWSIAVNRFK